MYGNLRSPFAQVAAADLHTTPPQSQHRTVTAAGALGHTGAGTLGHAAVGALGHAYYPTNYHLYNIPTGALAHRYAVDGIGGTGIGIGGAGIGMGIGGTGIALGDYSPAESEDILRRRGSGERRGSGAGRRDSGQGGAMDHMTTGPPGKKNQRFEILRKLGSGTYGRVSLAMDHKAGEEVAVKVIRKSAIENTADLIRIRREIRIMSALKHPNIIEIKEVFENDEKIILVMEYASGGELYDFVGKHGPLPEEEVRRLFRQVVSAVFYCHRHGVAHRDLKLENILLDKDMGAKIADFGLSNYFTQHSLLRTFCGSPLYASPEIINGTPYHGPEVDCWSLGVLLYTLAYSSMPFDGRDFNRMARQIKRGAYYEPDPPSSASMLIRSMLRVNHERRATIADIAIHWWLNFDENASVIADLPENQVLDATPLYIRQETMMIQSFGEENEMFAEFTHLSDATRKKIEEFRRRRREAEWYLTECQAPLKKQSKKRSSSIVNEQQKRQSSQAVVAGQKQSREASAVASGADVPSRKNSKGSGVEMQKRKQELGQQSIPLPAKGLFSAAAIAAGEAGGMPDEQLLDNLTDPLNRLKALENRLQQGYQKEKSNSNRQVAKVDDTPMLEETVAAKPAEDLVANYHRPSSLNLTERPQPIGQANTVTTPQKQKPGTLRMSVDDLVQEKRALDKAVDNTIAASVVSAAQEDANRMVNQLLEVAMQGTVPPELIDSIRATEAFKTEPFIKEILESVLAAQQSKTVTTPSTPTTRTSRSKSKQSSMTRMPSLGSTASVAAPPLPDVVSQDSDKIKIPAPTPPPDIVAAVAEVVPQQPTTPPTPPVSAPAPMPPLPPPTKVIYQTVPEDAELQLTAAMPRAEIDAEPIAEPPSTPASSEPEEDVCSTDFEDLGSEEEEDEAARSRRGDESPLSGTGSFASTHSHIGELPEIRIAPTETNGEVKTIAEGGGTEEDNPFLRGLSKRLSRGKYERSKYIFGRGVSIEESPRSSRRRLAAERKAANQIGGQGSLEENESEQAAAECPEVIGEQNLAEGEKSPRRRRYSDGDKNHLDPQAKRDDWLKSADSDLGSSQDIDSPPPGPNPDARFHYDELERKAEEGKTEQAKHKKTEKEKKKKAKAAAKATAPPAEIVPAPVVETVTAETPSKESAAEELMNDEIINASQRRREERKKQMKGFLAETPTSPEPPPSPAKVETAPESEPKSESKAEGEKESRVDQNAATHIEQPEEQKLVETVSATVQVKDFPKGDAEANSKTNVEKKEETTPSDPVPTPDAKTDESPKLKKELKKSSRRRASVADANSEKLVSENSLDDNKEKIRLDKIASTTTATTADQRRHSYLAATDTSSNNSQEGNNANNGNPLPKSPTATIDTYTSTGIGGASSVGPAGTRSSKYQLSGGGVVSEPMWLQYAREETQRHQPQSSAYHHGYGAGDYKSSVGHGYDRTDDDYLGTRTHLPQSTSYRVGGTYASRDLSPPRTGISPAFRTHVDPSDSASLGYGSAYQSSLASTTTPTSRGRKSKPLYHQQSSDEIVGNYDDSTSNATNAAAKRYSSLIAPGPAVSGYTPSYSRRTTGSGDYYKSLYDDNVVYRRSHYDVQPEIDDDWKPSDKDSTSVSGGNQFRVFQPKGLMKRRSRSLDKTQARRLLSSDNNNDDHDASPPRSNYLDNGNYHYPSTTGTGSRYESSLATGASVGAHQPSMDANSRSQLKSILKKQPTFDSTTAIGARYGEPERKGSDGDGSSRAMNFIDRLRRHLSDEKSPEPPDFVTSASTNLRPKIDSTTYAGSGDNGGLDYGSNSLYSTDAESKSGHKKRNFNQPGRRRTTEIRYGANDAGSNYGDHLYTASDLYSSPNTTSKRATSPIEKIKGFFGGATGVGTSTTKSGRDAIGGSGATGAYHYPSSATTYSPYQSTTPSTSTSSNYTPGYRKYQPTGTAYRPTSYGPSSRYWHEDSSLY